LEKIKKKQKQGKNEASYNESKGAKKVSVMQIKKTSQIQLGMYKRNEWNMTAMTFKGIKREEMMVKVR
jgi:hypothetical protein